MTTTPTTVQDLVENCLIRDNMDGLRSPRGKCECVFSITADIDDPDSLSTMFHCNDTGEPPNGGACRAFRKGQSEPGMTVKEYTQQHMRDMGWMGLADCTGECVCDLLQGQDAFGGCGDSCPDLGCEFVITKIAKGDPAETDAFWHAHTQPSTTFTGPNAPAARFFAVIDGERVAGSTEWRSDETEEYFLDDLEESGLVEDFDPVRVRIVTASELDGFRSEVQELKSIIEKLPEDQVIARTSFAARLGEVEEELEELGG